MSEAKQIEEFREISDILTEAAHMACEDIPLMPGDRSVCMSIPCHRCKEARLLVYKGYRKQSEVAAEIFAEIENLIYLDQVGRIADMSTALADLKFRYTGE